MQLITCGVTSYAAHNSWCDVICSSVLAVWRHMQLITCGVTSYAAHYSWCDVICSSVLVVWRHMQLITRDVTSYAAFGETSCAAHYSWCDAISGSLLVVWRHTQLITKLLVVWLHMQLVVWRHMRLITCGVTSCASDSCLPEDSGKVCKLSKAILWFSLVKSNLQTCPKSSGKHKLINVWISPTC